MAGCPRELFRPDAIRAIWGSSGGVPRLINAICDQGLVNAYGAKKNTVDLEAVGEAVSDLAPVLEVRPTTPEKSDRPLASEHALGALPPPPPSKPQRPPQEQNVMYGVRLATFDSAEDAKAYAQILTDRGHEVRAVRSLLANGMHVTHVIGGLYSDRSAAVARCDQCRSQGHSGAEVLIVSGWSTSGTLHTSTSSKESYLKRIGPTDAPKPAPARPGPRSWPRELSEH
jgi:hypothetical protein